MQGNTRKHMEVKNNKTWLWNDLKPEKLLAFFLPIIKQVTNIILSAVFIGSKIYSSPAIFIPKVIQEYKRRY